MSRSGSLDPAEKRLKKATIKLLLDQPFFGTLAAQLPNEITHAVDTAATNGKRIIWNPDFVAKLNDRELMAVIVHEIMHVANGHPWRRNHRDVMQWNVACDQAINGIITQSGFSLPDGALMPVMGDEGRAAEHYYRAPQKVPGNGACGGSQPGGATPSSGGQSPETGVTGPYQGNSQGAAQGAPQGVPDPGGCGGVMDAPSVEEGDHETAKEEQANWKVAVSQAAMAAKSHGGLPGALMASITEIVSPKVPWKVLLADFVERTAKNDYAWTRPNRRHILRGVMLPTLISDELPSIVAVLDTSGSISQEELNQFAAEVSDILQAYSTTVHVIYADAKVQGHEELRPEDLPFQPTEIKGRGGTDFRPVFKWVKEKNLDPAAMIYLTDGYGNEGRNSFPSEEPEYPVLWAMTSGVTPPFGEVVDMT